MTEVLMGLVIFGGLPLVSAARSHIAVDFLTNALRPRPKRFQTLGLDLVCAAVSGVLAWRTWLYAGVVSRAGETTLELKISMGLITHVVAVLLGFTAIVFLFNAWIMLISTAQVGRRRGH
jgi:TRAP-type C4-dicarboxylate transport system permease small subunit